MQIGIKNGRRKESKKLLEGKAGGEKQWVDDVELGLRNLGVERWRTCCVYFHDFSSSWNNHLNETTSQTYM
jgi:hypothetical protein